MTIKIQESGTVHNISPDEKEKFDSRQNAAYADRTERIAKEREIATARQARTQSFNDNIPSWAQVDTAISNISSLAEAKAFIRKMARVVYWLAKNTEA